MRALAPLAVLSLLGAWGCAPSEPAPAPPPDKPAASEPAPAEPAPAEPAAASAGLAYPETKKAALVETLHGVEVPDPYRWLEDDVRVNADVAAWVDAQQKVAEAYLSKLPGRDEIKAKMAALWDFDKYSDVAKRGGRYFFRLQSGLQNQSVLYVQDGLDGGARVLIDPNPWAKDGATALASYHPSDDGAKVAYAIQDGGADWRTIQVIDVASGEVAADKVEWVKFSNIDWAPDGSGFYYARFPKPEEGAAFQSLNYNHQVYFHKLGTAQSEDRLVYARPESPTHGFGHEVTDDGKLLLITVAVGTDDRYELVAIALGEKEGEPRLLVGGFENDYALAGKIESTLYFRTNRGAPRGRVIAMDLARPEEAQWREIVPQADAVLTGAEIVGDRLIAHYLEDAKSVVRLYTLDGAASGEVALPGLGVASGFSGKPGDPETFYGFESFNRPTTLYRLDTATGASTVFKAPTLPFKPDDYRVDQVFYASKDGTRVPMFIVARKDVDRSVPQPTMLYGYGGFNISVTPNYSTTRLAWLELGGVYASANLRGGGEYGKAWHDAGRLAYKQNVFDDFAAAAEYLIANKVATAKQLAISGRSNGGLLVGAVANQRPELFAAALPAVGVMDMLRFNRFTAGRYWVDDYGDPGKEADFKAQLAYSPYHNVKEGGALPAILVTTADTDDRVVPGHSFKYAARIQAAQGGEAAAGAPPRLIRIETRAGHGSGKPTDKIIAEFADQWAFAAHHTGLVIKPAKSGPGGESGAPK